MIKATIKNNKKLFINIKKFIFSFNNQSIYIKSIVKRMKFTTDKRYCLNKKCKNSISKLDFYAKS